MSCKVLRNMALQCMLTSSRHVRDGCTWTEWSRAFQNAQICHHRGPACQEKTSGPPWLMQNAKKNILHNGVPTKKAEDSILVFIKNPLKVLCIFFHQDSKSGLGIEIWHWHPDCQHKPKFSLIANIAVDQKNENFSLECTHINKIKDK